MEFTEWIKQSWIYVLAFGSGLGAILSLSKNIKELKDKLEAPQKAQDAKIAALEEKVEQIQDGRVGCGARWEHIDATEARFEQMFANNNEAQVALLRDRISSYYFDKCNDKGFITPIELEIVNDLYKAYHQLGGNGMISREMEIINKFPVFNDKEEYDKWIKNKKANNN